MDEATEKQKLFILLGIFGLAALMLYYNLLLKPQFSSFITMNREFYKVRQRVKAAEQLIASEASIRKQYEDLKGQSESYKKRLLGQDEISKLLGDFSTVAESTGVKILRVKPLEKIDNVSQTGAENEPYSKFPILIEARAGYHQCGKFINRLESMDTFILIDELDIRGSTEDPRRHDIRMRALTYLAK